MPARVQPGQKLAITAKDYNRLLAAADMIHRNRLPGGGGPRTHLRDARAVRVHNTSAATIPIGGIVGFESPLTDPTVGPAELARFVRDATIQCVVPSAEEHSGRVGVAIEPIAADKVGRVVFDGVVAARVNIVKAWHQFADVGETGGDTLHSKPDGSAQILWRQNPESVGLQWAVVRIGKIPQPIYLAKILPGGVPPRNSNKSGNALCELTLLRENGQIEPLLNPDESPVLVQVFNHSRQRIRGTVSTESEAIYRLIRFNQKDGWAIDPPTQTLLCRPTGRIRPKSWGQARELRLDAGKWKPSGNLIEVYNVCDMALLTSQHVVCHFHEDADSYIGVSSRCCDESSSSSYSSYSESASEPSQSQSDSQSDQSQSDESDSNQSQGSESDDSRSEGSTHSDSAGSDHESDKSTAIVPASFTPGGFTALFTLEAPEVRFDDVFRVQSQPGRITTVAADPRFVEVCERGTLCIDSVVASKPAACGARIDCDGIVRIELDREFTAPVELTVRVTGIRRGFLGKRFPNRTRQQFDANERFLQSAYPGAGQ